MVSPGTRSRTAVFHGTTDTDEKHRSPAGERSPDLNRSRPSFCLAVILHLIVTFAEMPRTCFDISSLISIVMTYGSSSLSYTYFVQG